jgi:hypothetical protein
MVFGADDGSMVTENGVKGRLFNGFDVVDDDATGVELSKNLFPTRHLAILHPSLEVRAEGEILDPDELGWEVELPGWHGYVEWEKYPEKKNKI